jgi:isopenicillin-N epimerase
VPGDNDLRHHWQLDPEVDFHNHGSFGACPIPVLEHQRGLRERMERQPVQFLARELEPLLDEARGQLAAFVGAAAEDLAWVSNATTGVNAVLQALAFSPGDELLTTDHEYNACRNALEFVARRAGATVVVVPVPFPIASPDEVVEAVLSRVTRRTRIALVDHVTSQTGLILPVERLVRELAGCGVDTLVDGAHAPGMLELSLDDLGAAFFTGNCHKWVCAPKGAAFLHVRRDLRERVRPVVISHGANSTRTDRSRFHLEFDWVGTDDPTAVLCVPEAIRFMGSLLAGGWQELRRRNRQLALQARDILCRGLGIEPPCPDEMIGSMAALPLPRGGPEQPVSALYTEELQLALLERWRIEVPIIPWPAPPDRLVRISAQAYNRPEQYRRLAGALAELLAERALER